MKFQDLSRRTIYTLISLLLIALIMVFAYFPFVSYLVAALTAVIGGIAICDYATLNAIQKRKGLLALLVCSTVLIILSFYFSTLNFSFSLLPMVAFFIAVMGLFIYHFDKIQGATQAIAKGVLGLIYVAVPLGLLLKILYLYSPCKMGHLGRIWVIYLLVVTKITDVGAYFGGRLLGNKKLASHISPGKTIVGACFGFLFAIVFSLLFYALNFLFTDFTLSFFESLYLGAIIGVLGQFGDLAESLIKRDADVKDSNRLPGLGGVLDMVDSLLFTVPIIYFFLYFC